MPRISGPDTWIAPRRAFALAFAGAAAVITGCGAAEIEDSYDDIGGSEALRQHVFASFEERSGWVVDGADDPGRLTRSNARATHGRRSLHLVAERGKRRKVSMRRDVSVDLGGVRSASVDAWVAEGASGGPSLALAFVTNPGHVYHETPAVKLPAGWNTVTFRLDGPHMKTAETRWQHEAVLANAGNTVRIVFVLNTGQAGRPGEGPGPDRKDVVEVFFDRLRFEAPAEGVEARVPPAELAVLAAGRRAPVHGTFEVEATFVASHGSPFDPREVQVFADFRAPSGATRRVPGFVTSGGRWLVRYMPAEAGRHSYHVGVQNRYGRTTSLPRNFLAEGRARPVPVRVSTRDPRQFEHVTGEPFYPVGLNVAWASDFKPYFEKFAAVGGNLVRIWLAPWCLPVASRQKAGEVDLEAADRLAEVLAEARRAGLRVQLVFAYHGEFLEGWKESPYSAANGGPCAVPAAFFAEPAARSAFKRLLRYVAARFATEPALFAWELFNELDLPPSMSRRDVIEWHREMARYLRHVDHVGRPVTSSACGLGAYPEIDALDEIDFLQGHTYRADVAAGVLESLRVHARFQKPAFLGEFGGGSQGATDQTDTEGVRLRAGLWLTLASPAAGTGLPWWWDTQIDPNSLYTHWIPVAALARRIDRRGKGFRLAHQALDQVASPRGHSKKDKKERKGSESDGGVRKEPRSPAPEAPDGRREAGDAPREGPPELPEPPPGYPAARERVRSGTPDGAPDATPGETSGGTSSGTSGETSGETPDPVPYGAPAPIPDSTVVHGILSRTEGLLYFYDRRVLASYVIPPEVLPDGARLTVRGLVDGEFLVETWEGSRRRPSRAVTARAEGGRLVLELPASLADFAVYFKAKEAPEPGIER